MKKKLLLAAIAIASAWGGLNVSAQINALPASAPETGDYYVYNVEHGMYIVESNDYGTRAGFDRAGRVITVNNAGDGTLTLVTNINGAGKGIFIADGNGETVYTDNTPTVWTYECIDEANQVYTLKNGDSYLQAKTGQTRLEAQPLPGDKSAQWQFIKKEVRQDISAASAENPVDVTYLLENPGFDRYNNEQNSWKNADGGNWRPGDNWCRNADASNNCGETWNTNFDIHQTVTDAPNGVYELRMQGYYRISGGNNSDVLTSKLNNGEDVLRTKYYLNNTEAFLMHQFADPLPDGYAGSTATVNGVVIRYPNSKSEASIAFRDGFFENEPITAVVNDGVVTIGLKLDNKNGEDWNCFDNFRLYYLGLPDVSQYVEALEKAIAQAEAFNPENTSTVLANALAQAITDAKAALDSKDSDVLSAAEAAVTSALNAAKAVNVSTLRQIIALAVREGVNADAANDVIANATESNTVTQAVDALNIQRRMKNLVQPDIYTGTAPADGAELYFYNLGTNTFLGNGSDWNTHAAVVYDGLPVTLHASGEQFTLTTAYGSFNDSPYVDTGVNTQYEFRAVEGKENVYNIVESGRLLGWNPDGEYAGYKYWTSISNTEGASADDPIFQWKLVTRQERIDLLQNATAENPVDASFFIKGGDLNRLAVSNWKKEASGGNGGAFVNIGDTGDNNRQSNYAYEFFECTNIRFTQDLTDLPRGNYRVSVQGFYREKNGGGQAEIVNNGGELRSNGYLMANNEKQFLPNIATVTDVAPGIADLQYSNAGYFPNMPSSAIKFMEYGYYKTDVDVTVGRDGKLTIGLGLDERFDLGDWIVVDNFRMQYLGSDVDINVLIANLQKAIEAAEAFDGKTTDAVAAALTAAIEEGKSFLTSTNVDDIEDAIVLVNEALAKAKAVNTEILVATIPLAQGEGIDVATANDVIVNATEQADVDQALFDLRAARKLNAQRMKDIYTGSAPAAGKVYIFNVGTGLFLGTGSRYNTHAAVDQAGIEVELVDLDEPKVNNFKIKTERGGGWFNWGGYVDTSNPDIWYFLPVEGKEGVYNISSTGNDGNLLGYDPNFVVSDIKFWSTIAIDRTGFDNPMNQWKIVTAAEREALIEKANAVTPIEVSYLIKSPSLNKQDNRDVWVKTASGGNGGAVVNNDNEENYGYEFWNTDNFSFTQTLEGLKPGVYEVSANAFYRDGDGGYQAGVVNDGGELLQLAYLVANDVKAPIANIASAISKVPGAGRMQACNGGEFPNYPEAALEYFETGYYKNTVEVLVGEDGVLKLGIVKDEKANYGDWVVLDNFRLIYKGAPTEAVSIPKTWNFSNWEAREYDEPFLGDGLTLAASDKDNRGITIEKKNATVEEESYTQWLVLESTGTENDCYLTFLAPGDFNIDVVLTSYSKTQERQLNIAVGEFSNVKATMAAKAGSVTKETASIQADLEEPVYIYSEKNPISIYAIYLSQYDDTVTGIAEVAADGLKGQFYNLQGQKVNMPKKGLYIVGNKKVIVK